MSHLKYVGISGTDYVIECIMCASFSVRGCIRSENSVHAHMAGITFRTAFRTVSNVGYIAHGKNVHMGK